MENEQISMLDILIETHIGLARQGPGSPETTMRALSFLDSFDSTSKIADLGCGTGGQTMVLAKNLTGNIVGVDQIPEFISVFNENVVKLNLQERVNGIIGDITALPFEKDEFDLIWSEGVIDSIGFEKGLIHWKGFLKIGGYVAITCPSWLTDKRPAEVAKFWADAGSELYKIGDNIENMQKSGYSFIAAFALSDECWIDNYFSPRDAAERVFLEKHTGNQTVDEYLEKSNYEVELYSKYKQHYGYVFYIGKKVT